MPPTVSNGLPVYEAEVLIIGAGATGCGVMRDLALRGIRSILIDKGDLNAGASGANHGLLHSGGRYIDKDTQTAAECREEGDIIRQMMPHLVDDCGGLFVAVEGDDPAYADRFPDQCAKAGIDCTSLSPDEVRELEPAISDRVFAAYAVADATIDPFRLTIEHVSHACQLTESEYLPHTELLAFERDGSRIVSAICRNMRTGERFAIQASQYVNAAGAWALKVAELAGCDDFAMLYAKGTLAVTSSRLTKRVVNRLRAPGDGDIVVPGGTVSIVGTTSDKVAEPDGILPLASEVDRNIDEARAMIPALDQERFIRAYAGVRPLLASPGGGEAGREASRGFALMDHAGCGVTNFATIAGGKLTTFRLMAERTGDLVAGRLGVKKPCLTANVALPSADGVSWTEPGRSARYWVGNRNAADAILCECEMVSQSVVDSILAESPGAEPHMPLRAIALRSRLGKGSCQGSFCALRATSYLYDRGTYSGRDGLLTMREFLAERYKGVRPVLWGKQMPQAELAETLHCGLMGLDLLDRDENGGNGG